MAWLRVGQGGSSKTSAMRPTPPRVQARQAKTGTLTAAIFLIENENVPTDMETQQLRGVSKGSKVLDADDRRPTKPTFKTDDDKLTYQMNMIEYKPLMDFVSILHAFIKRR